MSIDNHQIKQEQKNQKRYDTDVREIQEIKSAQEAAKVLRKMLRKGKLLTTGDMQEAPYSSPRSQVHSISGFAPEREIRMAKGILLGIQDGSITVGSNILGQILTKYDLHIRFGGFNNPIEKDGYSAFHLLIEKAAQYGLFSEGQSLTASREQSMAEKYGKGRPMVARDIGIA